MDALLLLPRIVSCGKVGFNDSMGDEAHCITDRKLVGEGNVFL